MATDQRAMNEQAESAENAAAAEQPVEDAAADVRDASADAPQDGPADAPQDGPADAAELTVLLEDARAKVDQSQDQLLRTRAEMENMKRRQAKELENAHKFALEGFVKELLPVRDSLELGLAAAQESEGDVAQLLSKLLEGTELTLKQLGDVMGKFGIERVHPDGEPFNPEYHQAMSMQPRADLPPNTVTAVIQSGYLLNGRLVRPALVMVSRQD
ncbi:nucleotide exchange factor GrpE [Thiohalocapsa marina]|uniref:Protein GrpE n=2 Tax=Thiohalocapsa marina TaxID=424902 RepID=A0A5M8FJR7_9GAMM|nr:nucleotide exchange factor GrpE [Thiohalocapsa marina]